MPIAFSPCGFSRPCRVFPALSSFPPPVVLSKWVSAVACWLSAHFFGVGSVFHGLYGVEMSPSIPLLTTLKKTNSEINEIHHRVLGLPQHVGHFFHGALAGSRDETQDNAGNES